MLFVICRRVIAVKQTYNELSLEQISQRILRFPYKVYKQRFLVVHRPARTAPRLNWHINKCLEMQQFNPESSWKLIHMKVNELWDSLDQESRKKEMLPFEENMQKYKLQLEQHHKQIKTANLFHTNNYMQFVKDCYAGNHPDIFQKIPNTSVAQNSKRIGEIWKVYSKNPTKPTLSPQDSKNYQIFRMERQIPVKMFANSFSVFLNRLSQIDPKADMMVGKYKWAEASLQQKMVCKKIFEEEQAKFKFMEQAFLKRHSLSSVELKQMIQLAKAQDSRLNLKKKKSKSQKNKQDQLSSVNQQLLDKQ